MLPISHIPHEPGIYLFKNKKGQILYIGKAKNLHKRVQQYFTPGSVWKQDMVHKAHAVEFIQTQSESEALFLEDNLIKQHQPPYNSLLKGDNSYGFIKITNETFPQVFFTRDRKEDGATYLGPKCYTRQIKDVLHYMRQLLLYRGCKRTQFAQGKLCSDYYRGICAGRCALAKLRTNSDKARNLVQQAQSQGLVIDHDYEYYLREYKKIMQTIQDVFNGEQDEILDDVRSQIDDAVLKEHYERAARLRDIYQGLQQTIQRQHVVIDKPRSGHVRQIKRVGSRWVYIIGTFQKGRIVDIIRQKFEHFDLSLNELLTLLEVEYGTPTLVSGAQEGYRQLSKTEDGRDVDRTDRSRLIDYLLQYVDHGIIGITGDSYLRKDYYQEIGAVLENALESYIVSTSRETDSVMGDILETFQQRYALKSFPYHIECVDISHMGGKHTSGGLAALQGGIPYKYGYRNYNIQTVSGGDDYGALTELITRRFKLSEKKLPDSLPDLFILDGGLRQLGLIPKLIDTYPEQMKTLMQTTQFAALEKGKGRQRSNKKTNPETLHILLDDGEIVSKQLIYDQVDQLLVQLRDESHRFANRQRKKGMQKEFKSNK